MQAGEQAGEQVGGQVRVCGQVCGQVGGQVGVLYRGVWFGNPKIIFDTPLNSG